MNITLSLPEDVNERLREVSRETRKPMSSIIADLVREHLHVEKIEAEEDERIPFSAVDFTPPKTAAEIINFPHGSLTCLMFLEYVEQNKPIDDDLVEKACFLIAMAMKDRELHREEFATFFEQCLARLAKCSLLGAPVLRRLIVARQRWLTGILLKG